MKEGRQALRKDETEGRREGVSLFNSCDKGPAELKKWNLIALGGHRRMTLS